MLGETTMAIQEKGSVRALALVGPTSAGKTALMEALLHVTGAADRRGEVGDTSPEAKARGHSVELNLAGFDFMGDRYVVVDCPGSLEFCAELDAALPAVDLAVVVAEPEGPQAEVYRGIAAKVWDRLQVEAAAAEGATPAIVFE